MTDQPRRRTGPRGPWTTFWLAFGVLFLMMGSYSLATPQGASPDEPAHAMRAYAAAHGQLFGPESRAVPGTLDLRVSEYFAQLEKHMPCFKRDVTHTPACVTPIADEDAVTTGHSSTGISTPVFYLAVGWPTAVLDGAKGLYAMRLVGAALCAALLALAFVALRSLPRARWATLALAVGVTPMTLFLSGTVNPNGLEVAATAAAFALLLATFATESSRRILAWRLAGVVVVSILLVNTRSIALLWLLLALVAALILSDRAVLRTVFRWWATWVGVGIVVAVTLAVAVFYLRPRPLTPAYQPIGAGSSWGQGFSWTIDQTSSFMTGWIAQFGWLEIPAPAIAILIWATLGGGLLLTGLVYGGRRVGFAALPVALAIVFVPPFSQAAVIGDAGYIWQGRYTLAPAVLLVVLAGIGLDRGLGARFDLPLRPLVRVGVVLLGIGHVAAFVWMVRRYVTGLTPTGTWLDLLRHPLWQPPGGWVAPVLVLTAASVAGAWLLASREPVRE
ncbi:DUF2142 domain-containing protein [Leifsonia sp. fls2-241-R2A-40a]|uniref:DUF2142 domain-containing protein n=1 Tax=Leifsonia sp. fls2-241-R2A-40a TaxID=3040290 RepID=UPI00254DC460|nr:DUF2142 domain-containing protein [Leifsonia sp. fls2-241-R2A-40a]